MEEQQAGRRVRAYVGAVIAAGITTVGAAVWTSSGNPFGPVPWTFALFATLLFMGELRPIRWLRRREGGSFTASWTFACALLLVAPPVGAILTTALVSLAADLIGKCAVRKALFNAANLALSLGCGALILAGYEGAVLLSSDASLTTYLPSVAAALAAVFIVNGALTSIVIALSQEVSVWPMVRRGVTLNVSTDGMLLALAPILIVVAERSLLLVPLLLLTAWGVYRSAELALARQYDAEHDQLTDLPNRGAFLQQAAEAVTEAGRRGQGLAVVMIDLDGFKGINDRLGHHIGDLVLSEVAARLTRGLRASDVVARLGGDEFAILLTHVDDEEAMRIVDRYSSILSEPLLVQNFPVKVSASSGIALYPAHGEDVETLIRNADVAMYIAKQGGLGPQFFSSARDANRRGRLALLSDLKRGLEAGELILHYQPKVALATRQVVGVEALVRWQHPTAGMVPPYDFMPLAEHTELMGPFTEYVLRQALQQCAQWHARGIHLPVAVNGSARNLHDPRFPAVVANVLRETGVPPQMLELEITENTVMADPATTISVLQQLRELGVAISIDDFGTGYSSLANLRDLPVDRIKIDRSFVQRLDGELGDAHIVRSIINLAHDLGLGTIAEGVEDAATLQELQRLGADVAQGFLVSRPVDAEALTSWLHLEPGAQVPTWRTPAGAAA